MWETFEILGQDPKILELKVRIWVQTWSFDVQLLSSDSSWTLKLWFGDEIFELKRERKDICTSSPVLPPCPSVASFVFWLLVTPFNMGQIASAWQILGSPAAPLLGGWGVEGGWGFLRYSGTRLTRSPLLGNEQIAAESLSLLFVGGWSERGRASNNKQCAERKPQLHWSRIRR